METVVMKYLIQFIGFVLGAGLCCAQESNTPGVNVIPWPRELLVIDDELELTHHSRIIYATHEPQPLAELLLQEIYQIKGCYSWQYY